MQIDVMTPTSRRPIRVRAGGKGGRVIGFSRHAADRLEQRGIGIEEVAQVLVHRDPSHLKEGNAERVWTKGLVLIVARSGLHAWIVISCWRPARFKQQLERCAA